MNKRQRLDYIFGDHTTEYITNRFGWLEALLSDIRTLIDGGQGFSKCKIKPTLQGSHGAGNLSIPILVCTGLELASALYMGNKSKKYNATDNVKRFIEDFFPDDGKKIPLILWDGIRNGTTHVFIPNTIKVSKNSIQFSFFVNYNLGKPSYITKSNGRIAIHINSIQFYDILKQSIDEYKSRLRKDNILQCNFIDAWKCKRKPKKRSDLPIMTEVKYLRNKLKKQNHSNLFVKP